MGIRHSLLKVSVFLLMTASAFAFTPSRTEALAGAIARAEGFYVKGSVPARFHNPGDIRSHSRHAYAGQVGLSRHGYVIFRNDAAGWAALRGQIEKVISGESKIYTVNMTLRQFSKRYATSATWVRNVSRLLAVDANAPLWEVLDVAPALETKCLTNPVLSGIL